MLLYIERKKWCNKSFILEFRLVIGDVSCHDKKTETETLLSESELIRERSRNLSGLVANRKPLSGTTAIGNGPPESESPMGSKALHEKTLSLY